MSLPTKNSKDAPFISTTAMRKVDKLMTKHYHIPLLTMVENAGRNLADFICLQYPMVIENPKSVTVLIGQGGNGGGGLVAARHLHNRNIPVQIILATDESKLAMITKQQLYMAKAIGIRQVVQQKIIDSSVILDCLIGYGINKNPISIFADIITTTNESGIKIIALDTPSGFDPTSGKAYTTAIHANSTLTLALPKIGFAHTDTRSYTGSLFLADISVPSALYRDFLNINVSPDLFSKSTIVALET